MKNVLIIPVIVAIIFSAAGFYGGFLYAKSTGSPASLSQNQFLGPQDKNGSGNGKFAGQQGGNGFTTGEIIAKDEKSITIKAANGSSKIVLFSESTEIEKFVSGSSGDLEIGKTVTITGQSNEDGSMSAKSIQLRPANQNQNK